MNWRKAGIITASALAAWFLITSPEAAATFVGSIFGFLRSAAESLVTFLSSLG